MKIKEAFLGIFIILIVLVLIIPIPSFLLDFLFMINVFFAVLILLDAIYSKKSSRYEYVSYYTISNNII